MLCVTCRRTDQVCSVGFQFTRYEIVDHTGYEEGRRSGGLYRDERDRSLQLQSFMVSL